MVSLLQAFPPKACMHRISSHACYTPCPSHPHLLNRSYYICRRVQVMKFFIIMQFSPNTDYFIPLRSRYSPQPPVLKYVSTTTETPKWKPSRRECRRSSQGSLQITICLSMALQLFVGTWPLFSFLFLYTVGGTPWTGDQPVARLLPAHTGQHKHRKKRTPTAMP
jgi:hypothetical protein